MNNTKDNNTWLLKEIKNGNKKALEIFIKKNTNLVRSIAFKYQNRGLELEDLIQEGFIGLYKAIESFDFHRNVKFTTYSIYKIKSQISRAILKQGKCIYLPSEIDEKIIKLKQLINDLSIKLGKTPNLDEIIDSAKISKEEFLLLYNYFELPISINSVSTYIDDENKYIAEVELETTLSNQELSIEDQLELLEKKNIINNLLYECGLNDRAIHIIKLRYGFYDGKIYKYEDIAKMLNISFQAVHSCEVRALDKLRKYPKIIELVHYLDKQNEAIENIKEYNKINKKVKHFN